MPLFEYRCRDCSHTFEAIVHATNGRPSCPSCGRKRLEKLLSTFAVSTGTTRGGTAADGGCGTCGDPRGPGSCARGFDD